MLIFVLMVILRFIKFIIGDGDIAGALGLKTGSLSSVTGIINESNKLTQYISDSSKLTASNVVPAMKVELLKAKTDIRLSYTLADNNSPTVTWKEFWKYTDSSVNYILT